MRQFTASPAVRKNVPLLIALIGPSTSGKTYSAHRLAAGIARVQPGRITGIDTENRGTRMLELAEKFKFHHMPFEPPFGSLDYLAAMQQAASEGARTIIVDSFSHEHDGEGGMLDTAEAYVEERIRRKVEFKDLKSTEGHAADKERAKLKLSSFIQPKAARSKLINGILQLSCNVILCFRAKEKIQPVSGGEPVKLGWQPIGGDEFWYEMTARALLLPGANGVPEWDTRKMAKGELVASRRPEQFRSILADGKQLSEDMGEQMARWAAGSGADPVAPKAGNKASALSAINQAVDEAALMTIADGLNKRTWSEADHQEIHAAIETRRNDLTKE